LRRALDIVGFINELAVTLDRAFQSRERKGNHGKRIVDLVLQDFLSFSQGRKLDFCNLPL
jgi:hypothetical protein